MSPRAKKAELMELAVPEPAAIVRAYPDPTELARAYIDHEFARALGTDHEQMVSRLVEEGAGVTDADSYARVGERLKDVARLRKAVEDFFAAPAAATDRLHSMVCDRRAEILAPLLAFEKAAKTNRLALERLEAQRRREAEQRLAEAARQEEQERLAREAAHLEQRGEPELAAQVLEQAMAAPPPVITIASTLPTTKGVSSRSNWRWRPIGGDTPQARARAEKLVPREFLELSDKKLTAYAKAHGASARIPGVEFFDQGSITVR